MIDPAQAHALRQATDPAQVIDLVPAHDLTRVIDLARATGRSLATAPSPDNGPAIDRTRSKTAIDTTSGVTIEAITSAIM